MKRTTILIAFLWTLCLGNAQIKVAVVKPYLEGSASAIHVNLVKQSLVSTILSTEGYKAFSRNEIDAIFTEQSFQYGGDVNDATRKKIGDMYGADMLCISQIIGSGGELLMSAMLIDVQTAEIVASPEPIVVKATTQNVQTAAKNLALQLLNPVGAVTETQNSGPDLASNQTSVANEKPVAESGYVDLGLPSGTKWKTTNEDGSYNPKIAKMTFGNKVPTKEQLEELVSKCQWQWTGEGYKVVGNNGNYIYLPAAGQTELNGSVSEKGVAGYYCSSDIWWFRHITFTKDFVKVKKAMFGLGWSLRLVQN